MDIILSKQARQERQLERQRGAGREVKNASIELLLPGQKRKTVQSRKVDHARQHRKGNVPETNSQSTQRTRRSASVSSQVSDSKSRKRSRTPLLGILESTNEQVGQSVAKRRKRTPTPVSAQNTQNAEQCQPLGRIPEGNTVSCQPSELKSSTKKRKKRKSIGQHTIRRPRRAEPSLEKDLLTRHGPPDPPHVSEASSERPTSEVSLARHASGVVSHDISNPKSVVQQKHSSGPLSTSKIRGSRVSKDKIHPLSTTQAKVHDAGNSRKSTACNPARDTTTSTTTQLPRKEQDPTELVAKKKKKKKRKAIGQSRLARRSATSKPATISKKPSISKHMPSSPNNNTSPIEVGVVDYMDISIHASNSITTPEITNKQPAEKEQIQPEIIPDSQPDADLPILEDSTSTPPQQSSSKSCRQVHLPNLTSGATSKQGLIDRTRSSRSPSGLIHPIEETNKARQILSRVAKACVKKIVNKITMNSNVTDTERKMLALASTVYAQSFVSLFALSAEKEKLMEQLRRKKAEVDAMDSRIAADRAKREDVRRAMAAEKKRQKRNALDQTLGRLAKVAERGWKVEAERAAAVEPLPVPISPPTPTISYEESRANTHEILGRYGTDGD